MVMRRVFLSQIFVRSVRVISCRVASGLLGMALVLGPALGSWSQSLSLDSVDVGQSQSLDDVEQATSGTPDGDRLAESESLDQVPTVQSASLDSIPSTQGSSLDSVPVAQSAAPNNDNLVWRPSPCDQIQVPSVRTPQGSDASAWQSFLDAKRSQVKAAQRSVQTTTEAFGASLYQGEHLIATRVRLGEERDAARLRYCELRCEMQASLQAAERAGVLPGVLRPYETAALGN